MLMLVEVVTLPTLRVNISVVEPTLLVAVNETVDELVPDGVPLRIPVRAFSVRPRLFSVESVVLDAERVDGGKLAEVSCTVAGVPGVKEIVGSPVSVHPARQLAEIELGATGASGPCTTWPEPVIVGGKATTTSLNCFVDPPMPESTGCVGLKNVVMSNSNWHE